MIDLSNNNGTVRFNAVHEAGVRRVYLKLTEGAHFVDGKHADLRKRALAAGLRVGEYAFARPSQTSPRDDAGNFLRHLPKLEHRHSLRPCLDLEDPAITPSSSTGAWAHAWIDEVRRESGHVVVVYGSAWYLEACGFRTPPGPLWLASYGRNDGREHPFAIPKPWKHAAAHQYASSARVVGVAGAVDISRVLEPAELDVSHVTRRQH